MAHEREYTAATGKHKGASGQAGVKGGGAHVTQHVNGRVGTHQESHNRRQLTGRSCTSNKEEKAYKALRSEEVALFHRKAGKLLLPLSLLAWLFLSLLQQRLGLSNTRHEHAGVG